MSRTIKRNIEGLVPGMVVIGEHGGRSVVLGYPEDQFVDGTTLSMVATEHGVLGQQKGVVVNIDPLLVDVEDKTFSFAELFGYAERNHLGICDGPCAICESYDTGNKCDLVVLEPGENFDMFTLEGAVFLHNELRDLESRMLDGTVTSENLAYEVCQVKTRTARAGFPEVSDTEPEWAIVDFVNAAITKQDHRWSPITRDGFL